MPIKLINGSNLPKRTKVKTNKQKKNHRDLEKHFLTQLSERVPDYRVSVDKMAT